MEQFLLMWGPGRQRYFFLLDPDEVLIVASKFYPCRCCCEAAIQLIINYSKRDSNYKRSRSRKGQYYFSLIDENKKVIIVSERYDYLNEREDRIAAMKQYAEEAELWVDDSEYED